MNTESELLSAILLLEAEKGISREVLVDAIRQSLIQACRTHFQKNELDNVTVNVDPEKSAFEVYATKTVVENPEDEKNRRTARFLSPVSCPRAADVL